ncbi:MAG: DUF58 domain-containing protein [Actinomycetota bacterium]|nr:DUF58 domain-containing protein [Actinomycetota bacterium]
MNRRPTTKAGIIAVIGGLLVTVATTAQAGWLFVLAAGVLGLAASGLIVSHRLSAAVVSRSVPARARVGQSVTVALRVHNPSAKRLPVMRIEDRFPAFEELSVASEAVPPGGATVIELEREAIARGVFEQGDATLVTGAPFGLVRTKRGGFVKSRAIVHPAWRELRAFPLPETPAATADEALAVTRSGHGEVFAGVRDYRPGDQQRWVHWRTTARTGRLVVREHEEPARSPLVLVAAGLEANHSAEHVASAAASVGLLALSAGRPVHCVGHGRFGEHVENASRLGLLDWAAALEPSASAPEDAVGAAFRRWGRRCAFVLFEAREGAANGAALLARRKGAGVQIVLASCPDEEAHAG